MKTLNNSGPLLYRVEASEPPRLLGRKVRVHVVKYETYEMEEAEFEKMNFKIHDSNCAEAKEIAKLVNH